MLLPLLLCIYCTELWIWIFSIGCIMVQIWLFSYLFFFFFLFIFCFLFSFCSWFSSDASFSESLYGLRRRAVRIRVKKDNTLSDSSDVIHHSGLEKYQKRLSVLFLVQSTFFFLPIKEKKKYYFDVKGWNFCYWLITGFYLVTKEKLRSILLFVWETFFFFLKNKRCIYLY